VGTPDSRVSSRHWLLACGGIDYTGDVTTRQALHDLVDRLPEERLSDAEERLSQLTPVLDEEFWNRLEDAPFDDEPLTQRELAALERAERGESVAIRLTREEVQRLIDEAAKL
jgi:hypothetical protein